MITEKDAALSWCPFARVGNEAGCNRNGDGFSAEPNCIGSLCMAWRWGRASPAMSVQAPPFNGSEGNAAIIDRIRLRMAATGKSASAASVEAGMGRSAIQNILRGQSESPTVATAEKLAKALNCSLAYLLGISDLAPTAPADQDPVGYCGLAERPV